MSVNSSDPNPLAQALIDHDFEDDESLASPPPRRGASVPVTVPVKDPWWYALRRQRMFQSAPSPIAHLFI
jgi:hypothetical protein